MSECVSYWDMRELKKNHDKRISRLEETIETQQKIINHMRFILQDHIQMLIRHNERLHKQELSH